MDSYVAIASHAVETKGAITAAVSSFGFLFCVASFTPF
jgi:hypothetical protein